MKCPVWVRKSANVPMPSTLWGTRQPPPEKVLLSVLLRFALHKAVDYADENNLAGVVVCGSLYLAAEARPWLLKEAEK